MEDYIIKYCWSAAGYLLISLPVFLSRKRSVGVQAAPPVAVKVPEVIDAMGSAGVVENAVARRTEGIQGKSTCDRIVADSLFDI